MPKKITIKDCNFTIEPDKAIKEIADALLVQCSANLETAEALKILAGKVKVLNAPIISIGDKNED